MWKTLQLLFRLLLGGDHSRVARDAVFAMIGLATAVGVVEAVVQLRAFIV